MRVEVRGGLGLGLAGRASGEMDQAGESTWGASGTCGWVAGSGAASVLARW